MHRFLAFNFVKFINWIRGTARVLATFSHHSQAKSPISGKQRADARLKLCLLSTMTVLRRIVANLHGLKEASVSHHSLFGKKLILTNVKQSIFWEKKTLLKGTLRVVTSTKKLYSIHTWKSKGLPNFQKSDSKRGYKRYYANKL